MSAENTLADDLADCWNRENGLWSVASTYENEIIIVDNQGRVFDIVVRQQ